MTGSVAFEGRVEPLTCGRATYTILQLPKDAVRELGPCRRIEGGFLWTRQSLLDRIGMPPGEAVEVRLRPSSDDRVDLDPEIETALRAGQVLDAWEGLAPGKRRGLLYQIATAKTLPTRQKRIARLVEDLR